MNLENVPRFSPEHTEEDITIVRVSQHDQRIQAVEDRADIQAEAIRTLQMLVNDLIQTKPGPSVTYNSIVKSAPPSGDRQVNTQVKTLNTPTLTRHNETDSSGISKLTSRCAADNLSVLPKTESHDVQGLRDPSPSGYRFQKNELKRQKRAAIIGKRQNEKIKSGTKYTDLFISRVHNDVPIDDLKEFIEEEGINIIAMERVSHTESRMQSFNLTICSQDKDSVLNDSFWPEGVMCRQFFTRRNYTPEQ